MFPHCFFEQGPSGPHSLKDIFVDMRKFLIFIMLLAPMGMLAQARFGYYSHSEVLKSTSGYDKAMDEYKLLEQRCEAEIEYNERELTRKYVAFLDGQQDFPEPILRKRQKELQQMVDNSVVFRKKLKLWLAQAKDSLLVPCNVKINAALLKVCERNRLDYAIDSDEVKYRYISPAAGKDITSLILKEMNRPAVEPAKNVVECAEDTIPATDSVSVATDTMTIAADTLNVVNDSIRLATDTLNVMDGSIRVDNDSTELFKDVEAEDAGSGQAGE